MPFFLQHTISTPLSSCQLWPTYCSRVGSFSSTYSITSLSLRYFLLNYLKHLGLFCNAIHTISAFSFSYFGAYRMLLPSWLTAIFIYCLFSRNHCGITLQKLPINIHFFSSFSCSLSSSLNQLVLVVYLELQTELLGFFHISCTYSESLKWYRMRSLMYCGVSSLKRSEVLISSVRF